MTANTLRTESATDLHRRAVVSSRLRNDGASSLIAMLATINDIFTPQSNVTVLTASQCNTAIPVTSETLRTQLDDAESFFTRVVHARQRGHRWDDAATALQQSTFMLRTLRYRMTKT